MVDLLSLSLFLFHFASHFQYHPSEACKLIEFQFFKDSEQIIKSSGIYTFISKDVKIQNYFFQAIAMKMKFLDFSHNPKTISKKAA